MRVIAVFGSSKLPPDHPDYALAKRWGELIGARGFAVASGGYDGLMEAVSAGARKKGALVLGVTAPPVFPHRDGPNPHVDLELPSPSLLSRIERMLDLAEAFLALPGGIGTWTEIMAAWNLAYIRWLQGRAYKPLGLHARWKSLIRPGLEVAPEHLDLLQFIATEAELSSFLDRLG